MKNDDMLFLPATQILEHFRKGNFSPVELMKAVIEQCEERNPAINAITDKFYEDALERAAAAEARYRKGSNELPLDGIPVAVKDLHPVKNFKNRWGSYAFENHFAGYTLPILDRVFAAGGIMHIRTTTPEFAHAGHCHSPIHGVTRNPWRPEYSSCGSSGGSAASVIAGMAVMGDGDDGGGSLRMPASACGILGYKPPFGRNPCGLLDTVFETIIHVGMMTRSVDDMVLVQNIMSGADPMDPFSLPKRALKPRKLDDSRGFRIAVSYDLGFCEVEPEIVDMVRSMADDLRVDGAVVEEVDLDWQDDVLDAWITHYTGLLSTLQAQNFPRWQFRMDPFVRKLVSNGMALPHGRVKATEMVRSAMWRSLSSVFASHDLLICPTLGVRGLDAEHQNDAQDFRINGKRRDPFMGWTLTYPFNLLSPCPVASVPMGMNSLGLPSGMQIVGRPYQEEPVLELARRVEAIRPWPLSCDQA